MSKALNATNEKILARLAYMGKQKYKNIFDFNKMWESAKILTNK